MTQLPEVTEHECTNCGNAVKGLFGRWSCPKCKTSSPYVEPPEEYTAQLVNTPFRAGERPHHTCGEIHCVCPMLGSPRRK
ncbi:hypothetical protein BX283_7449 [Streptomyces sp. TLI_146]|nr:hypothetical protein BX283_7449 [Streptomyces sp. TLI_146]